MCIRDRSCRDRYAVHEPSKFGSSTELGQSGGLLVLDPFKEQGQRVGSDVQDSLLGHSAGCWCSSEIISNEPVAQGAILVVWLFVSEREKGGCYSEEQHGGEEDGPA